MKDGKRFDLDVGKRRARARLREFIGKRIYDRKRQNILCFPGEFGLEIEQIYRKLGFRDSNIYGVERDAKAAAAIRRRYPHINLFEGDIINFVMQYRGAPFAVVSLDYCGHFSEDKIHPLAMLAGMGNLASRSVVALNLMAGREKAEDQDDLRNVYSRVLQDRHELIGRPVQLDEAIGIMGKAYSADIAEVRDDAVTQSVLSCLSYLIPAQRACYGFELAKTRGTAIALQQDTLLNSRNPDGSISLSNVRVIESKPGSIQMAMQIKHEAIQDINETLRERGIIEFAKKEARALKINPEFFEYHLGRTLVMHWFDKYGYPDMPVALERYSYVSESGRRMVTDFVETRSFQDVLDSLPEMVQPFSAVADSSEHRFGLYPDPATFPSDMAYLQALKKTVVGYANGIAKHIKSEPSDWPDRVDLGGGEAVRLNMGKLKARAIELIKKGRSTEEIVQKLPYLPTGTIRALRAHVSMGTYGKAKIKA